jgi:hypothetical protein
MNRSSPGQVRLPNQHAAQQQATPQEVTHPTVTQASSASLSVPRPNLDAPGPTFSAPHAITPRDHGDAPDPASLLARRPSISQRVENALREVETDNLSKTTILDALERNFKDHGPGLEAATRDPEFSETLLESIRTRQSETWVAATRLRDVPAREWGNQELQHWNARHYTNKVHVVLGEALDNDSRYFSVRDVEPPPFGEILSTATLSVRESSSRPETQHSSSEARSPKRSGDRMLMTNSAGSARAGHTTTKDWANIGNVGDTFYGLFYQDASATGQTPNFIKDAVYYAKWSADEFGNGWASADWLSAAAKSRENDGPKPDDIARKGKLSDIVADIFPEAATRDLGPAHMEIANDRQQREQAFSKMTNFEVKKHGPMEVKAWIPVSDNIERMKRWAVDTQTGKFVKLTQRLPPAAKARLESLQQVSGDASSDT